MAALAAKLAEDGRAEDALAVTADPVAARGTLRKYGLCSFREKARPGRDAAFWEGRDGRGLLVLGDGYR